MQQQLQVLLGLLFITLLLASFFFFIIWTLSKMQQHKRALQEQANLLAEVTMQEKEKARITDQLHEDFGSLLSTVNMYLSNFTLNNKEEIEQRETARYIITDVLAKIRTIALAYLPYTLQKRNIGDALRVYVATVNAQQDDQGDLIRLHIDGALSAVKTTTMAVNLYRIVQELINNMLQHSKATALLIDIHRVGDTLLLKAKDNGTGFDYAKELKRAKGLGPHTILTRVKLLKGKLEVNAAPGGSFFLIELPL